MSQTIPKEQGKTNWKSVLLIFIGILTCSGFASLLTGFGFWDGMYPAGEYHLIIQDEAGKPVPGAALNVFTEGTSHYAFEYPVDNYLSAGDLINDENGVIVILHKPNGIEFGGGCWYLFWAFPICTSAPEFDFQISGDGYKTLEFSTDDLFQPAYNKQSNANTSVLLEYGEQVEIPVYELRFVLEN